MHLYRSNNFCKAPWKSLCMRVNDLRHSIFHLLNCIITTASELREEPKVTGTNIWTIGTVRNCLDAYLGQKVSDMEGVVDWCIVPVEMPLTRFDECWPNTNHNPLANQLWCIDFLTPRTPLIIPHRLPAFLESLMPHKNWYSIHARCLKSSLKHSIGFCGIFPSLKLSFIAYRSSKLSSRPNCIFEIH